MTRTIYDPCVVLVISKRRGTTGVEMVSVYENELQNFIRRAQRTAHYLDSAKNGLLTKEHLEYIESLISRRRQLEDELIRKIKQEV